MNVFGAFEHSEKGGLGRGGANAANAIRLSAAEGSHPCGNQSAPFFPPSLPPGTVLTCSPSTDGNRCFQGNGVTAACSRGWKDENGCQSRKVCSYESDCVMSGPVVAELFHLYEIVL